MRRIDSGYKLIEVLSGRRGSAETVVNVATVKFRFRAVVLIEKLIFNVAYEKETTHKHTPTKPHTTHNSLIRSDEGLTLETSAFESLYGG